MAGIYNICIDQGANWSIGIAITSDNVAFNMTGYTASCQFRATRNGPIVATPTIDMSAASSGTITLSLTSSQTSGIPVTGSGYSNVATYFYDLFITSPSSITTRVLNGTVSVSPEITQ